MSNVVVKPFKTLDRKFKPGDVVTEADIVGAMTLKDWIAAGFVASAPSDPMPVFKITE